MINSILMSLFLGLMVCSNQLVAQQNNIKAMLQADEKVGLVYEHALGRRVTASIGFLALNRNYERGANIEYNNIGRRFSGEFRLYKNNAAKGMTGFYIAPNFSIGKHKLRYEDNRTGADLWVLGLMIDALDGDLDVVHGAAERAVPIIGMTETIAMSYGLKLGRQHRKGMLTVDYGAQLNKNQVLGDHKGIPLNNGTYQEMKKDLLGTNASVYLALGVAF